MQIKPVLRSKMRMQRGMGIERNEHGIPRFQRKYGYLTNHSENTERPNSPNVLPLSQWGWVWDSSIQWISVYSLGIELNSWIGVKIL